MDRREAITTMGAITLAAVAGQVLAEDDHEHMHHHHHHSEGNPYQALITATGHCVSSGEICLAHCLVLLGDGDSSIADCAKTVNQMLAACRALEALAAQNSLLTKAMAKVALDACTQCHDACKEHAQDHAECRACMEACTECIKECKAVLA